MSENVPPLRMTSPVAAYQREMHAALGVFATWPPSEPIALGDIGTFVEGRFRKVAALTDLGIAVEIGEATKPFPLRYTSTAGTEVKFGADADVQDVAASEVSIAFARHGAYYFEAQGVSQRRLENRHAIKKEIVERWRGGTWKKSWYLIEDIYVAECATVVISQDSNATISIRASVPQISALSSLADSKLGFRVVREKGKIVAVIGARDARPLFRCSRLRTGWFGPPEIANHTKPESAQDARWERAEIDELVES